MFLLILILSLATLSEGSLRTLTPENIEKLLAAHNNARASVVPASVAPIPQLVWDNTLAASAANNVKSCVFAHNSGNYGENIAGGTARYYPEDRWEEKVVKDWVSEVSGYNINSNTCNISDCYHYLQVVWAKTLRVGCARMDGCAQFPQSYISCQYDPPGNMIGARPYEPVKEDGPASVSGSPSKPAAPSSSASASKPAAPSSSSSASKVPNPSESPSREPLVIPVASVSSSPSNVPAASASSSRAPTTSPTAAPTTTPSPVPTTTPTSVPTTSPTAAPTTTPSSAPTPEPTPSQTSAATAEPTPSQTSAATAEPTPAPTSEVTPSPSANPTRSASAVQTPSASADPTKVGVDIDLQPTKSGHKIVLIKSLEAVRDARKKSKTCTEKCSLSFFNCRKETGKKIACKKSRANCIKRCKK